MTKIQNSKPYDLEERQFQFAKDLKIIVKTLPKTIANTDDGKQLLVCILFEILDIVIWSLFEIWCLKFVISDASGIGDSKSDGLKNEANN